MDQKPYYPPTSPLELHASSSTRNERPSKHTMSSSIASKSRDYLLSWDKPIMINNFDAMTTTMLRKLPLMLATSSSGASRRSTTCTSYLPLGRDPSSSLKLSAHLLTAFNGATDKEYQTLGTWCTYDDSIHRIVF
jgi:hypothetical protein